ARQARPSGSAPRRMRSTLYCAPVRPADFRSCSAPAPSASAALRMATKARSSTGAEREDRFREFIKSDDSRYNDDCQEESVAGDARLSAVRPSRYRGVRPRQVPLRPRPKCYTHFIAAAAAPHTLHGRKRGSVSLGPHLQLREAIREMNIVRVVLWALGLLPVVALPGGPSWKMKADY